jgi:hypothetical protein
MEHEIIDTENKSAKSTLDTIVKFNAASCALCRDVGARGPISPTGKSGDRISRHWAVVRIAGDDLGA